MLKNNAQLSFKPDDKGYCNFYTEIRDILNGPLDDESFAAELLEIPRLQSINDPNHRAIVKDILRENQYLTALGPFGAFFHGYIGERYTLFRTLNQKLNLAMQHIYRHNAPRLDGPKTDSKIKDAINQLLCNHLEEMITHAELFGANLSRVYVQLKNASKTKIVINLMNDETFGIAIDSTYRDLVHSNYEQLQLTLNKNEDDIIKLRAEMNADRIAFKKQMSDLSALLQPNPKYTKVTKETQNHTPGLKN